MRRPVIWLLAACLAGCSPALKRPETVARGDYTRVMDYISLSARSEMKRQDVTGLSIALVDDQKVLYAAGFGYADKAGKVPASPETVYRVGSISKLFTATAAMQLAERKKLDIDRPLRIPLPEFSIKTRFPDAAPITPRSLMTHHAGLPSDFLKGMWSRNPEPFTTVVDRIREEYAAHPPDTEFSYSNLGVTLLGHAVEKVAGRDFAAHMRESVLLPLGMRRSSFSTGRDTSPWAAKGYRKGKETAEIPLRDVPAGGLNSSVLDLCRFMQMVFAGGRAGGGQILKPETLAGMLRPQNPGVPLDLDLRVGLGWMLSGPGEVDIRNAGPVAHHAGATLLHHGQLIILPEQKLGVVVLANSSTAGGAVRRVAVEALTLALEAKTGIRQPERARSGEDNGRLSSEALQTYAGRYSTVAGVVNVRQASDALIADVMNRTLRLVPRPDGWLGLEYRLLGLIRIPLGELDDVGISRAVVGGREILKARVHGREFPVGERIRPVGFAGKWLERMGEYEIANLGDDAALVEKAQLRREDGFIFLDYSIPLLFDGTLTLAVAPVSDTEATIEGIGRGSGETIRVVIVDGEERLSYSGYLFRKK